MGLFDAISGASNLISQARDIGSTLSTLKPDGTSALSIPVPTTIAEGIASVTSGLKVAGAVDNLISGFSKSINGGSFTTQSGKFLANLVPNPLEQFSSYSVLWTFACLTTSQFNNPASYRGSPGALSHVVFSSGGRFDSQRVNTFYGAPEYFINNFVMKSTIAANQKTGNSNAFKFEFEIYEPHSMGLLLQSLQNAAQKAGYVNYLDNAPYVLRMDIKGWDESGKSFETLKPKFFVTRLTSVKFSVTESGSTYKMEAIPYNHQGFSDQINVTYSDLKITASNLGNVEEVLTTGPESLVAVLNKVEEKLVAENKIGQPDVYDIQFPKDSSDFIQRPKPPTVPKATMIPGAAEVRAIESQAAAKIVGTLTNNEIGKSSLGFTQSSGGLYPFAKAGDTVDDKTGVVQRDKMLIDVKNRSFQFAQGQSLTAIINQVILSSDYAKGALDPKNIVDGMIKWWRVDVQMEFGEWDTLVQDYARKITYRVVPYYVHHSVFSNPTAAPLGYTEIEKKIVKEYNYIYTGQNADVLKFDIDINNLFFTGAAPKAEGESAKSTNPDSKGTTPQENKDTSTGKGVSEAAQAASLGRPRVRKDPDLNRKPVGGTGTSTTEQEVAESFHKAFVEGSSADMVTVNLEIMGDTYWLVDSGMANYFSPPASGPTSQVTADGSMNYEAGDVFIYLRFRTPVDIDEATGLYQFSKGGKESPFGGIYRVVTCENVFSDGTFKQKLKCIRMPGQALDYVEGGKPLGGIIPSKTEATSTVIGQEQKEKSSVIDDTKQEKKA